MSKHWKHQSAFSQKTLALLSKLPFVAQDLRAKKCLHTDPAILHAVFALELV
jgi:hypothetical protein